jgi:HEPN domain-containing protein
MTASLEEAQRFLSLASDDLAAFRALAADPHIRLATAIFHAQQSVEKSLKAILFAIGAEFRRTHDLYELADRIEQAGVALPYNADELGLLNPYAVDFRYDDQLVPVLSTEEVEAMTQGVLAWANTMVEGKGMSQ